jgi:hypothetical protein
LAVGVFSDITHNFQSKFDGIVTGKYRTGFELENVCGRRRCGCAL